MYLQLIIILTYEDQTYIFYYFVKAYVAALSISIFGFVFRKICFDVIFLKYRKSSFSEIFL